MKSNLMYIYIYIYIHDCVLYETRDMPLDAVVWSIFLSLRHCVRVVRIACSMNDYS